MKLWPVALLVLALVGCAEDPPEPAERWVVRELGTNAGFRDVFFLDEQRGWIVGGGHNIEGGLLGTTTDGGETWTFRDRIARPPGSAHSFHLSAIHFHDARLGFAAGDGGHLLRTVDGGEHWHPVAQRRGVWAHLSDLHFVGRRHGWVVGSGGFLRSVDGGESWTGADEGRRIDGLAIHFVDRERGVIVGKHGSIQRSEDGGRTWRTIRAAKTGREDLWGLDFGDETHAWAVGGKGTILHSADGGETWERQLSGVEHTLMDVDFLDASQGWAVGFARDQAGSSIVLWTRDGGATWTEQERVNTEGLRALFVLDETHAWTLGEQQRRSDEDGSQKLLRYEVREPGP